MLRGFFVTGTGTGVGKTVASAAVVHHLRDAGAGPLRYWKPVQTGCETDDDTADVQRLAACTNEEIWEEGIRLPRPLSPHLSAALAGRRIDVDPLVERVHAQPACTWIVEGAGGVLVPLNEKELMVDLMTRLALPVIVVSSTRLGTINHTLLTLEALRARTLTIAGVVMNGERNNENRDAIARYGNVRIIGELSQVTPLTAEGVRAQAAGFSIEPRTARTLNLQNL